MAFSRDREAVDRGGSEKHLFLREAANLEPVIFPKEISGAAKVTELSTGEAQDITSQMEHLGDTYLVKYVGAKWGAGGPRNLKALLGENIIGSDAITVISVGNHKIKNVINKEDAGWHVQDNMWSSTKRSSSMGTKDIDVEAQLG